MVTQGYCSVNWFEQCNFAVVILLIPIPVLVGNRIVGRSATHASGLSIILFGRIEVTNMKVAVAQAVVGVGQCASIRCLLWLQILGEPVLSLLIVFRLKKQCIPDYNEPACTFHFVGWQLSQRETTEIVRCTLVTLRAVINFTFQYKASAFVCALYCPI